MKPVMELFCENCIWYKPDWNSQTDDVPIACTYRHICSDKAKRTEEILKEAK